MARDRSFSLVKANDATPPAPVSPGVCPGQFLADIGARPVNLHAMRCLFPALWSAFVRANFTSTVHAAYVFGVDERTARAWWEGTTSPSAPVLAAIEDRRPGTILAMLRAAA